MRRKIRRVQRFHGPRGMTQERGSDDAKLFPSSQSVNYSFLLIRLCPPHHPSHQPSHHSISQSEILSELIPGNVYFEEQIVALLLTQCAKHEQRLLTHFITLATVYIGATHVAFPILTCQIQNIFNSHLDTNRHQNNAILRQQCFKLNAYVCMLTCWC